MQLCNTTMAMVGNKTRKILIVVTIITGIWLFRHVAELFYVRDYSLRVKQSLSNAITESNNVVSTDPSSLPKQNQSVLDAQYKDAVSKGCPFPQLSQFPNPLTNFETFPCVGQLTPSEQLKQNGQCVRTVNFPKDMLLNKTGCTVLKTGRGTPICTYESAKDIYVSGDVNSKGMWEKDLVNLMIAILQKNPDMVLLDGGCNIGVYTLAAAVHSHTVVSIDANFENLFLLSKSLTHGNLSENVTLIWNAVSQKREMVVLRKQLKYKNVGGWGIDAKNKATVGCDIAVNAIILDDLKEMFANKTVYMKLDIQGEEHNLINNGKEFFKMVDVRYVQLEYVMQKGKPGGKLIIDCMISYGFLPYSDCRGDRILKPFEESKWPYDMCFIR